MQVNYIMAYYLNVQYITWYHGKIEKRLNVTGSDIKQIFNQRHIIFLFGPLSGEWTQYSSRLGYWRGGYAG